MENNINVELSLTGEDSTSELKKTVYGMELEEISSKFPLMKNEIDIKQTYITRIEDRLEVGFFIRNGLGSELVLEHVLLEVQDNKGNKVGSKLVNFKDYEPIPACSARHFIVNFKLRNSDNYIEGEDYTVNFAQSAKLEAIPTVLTEIENMPINLSFEEEKLIRDFADSLETLRVDAFDISVYNLYYKDNGGIQFVLLMRNGKDETVSLASLPVSIINDSDITIAHKVFENKKGLLNVSPRKSKLLKLEFNMLEVPAEKYDLAKCKVRYK
jgi:SLAP domain-containing protein